MNRQKTGELPPRVTGEHISGEKLEEFGGKNKDRNWCQRIGKSLARAKPQER